MPDLETHFEDLSRVIQAVFCSSLRRVNEGTQAVEIQIIFSSDFPNEFIFADSVVGEVINEMIGINVQVLVLLDDVEIGGGVHKQRLLDSFYYKVVVVVVENHRPIRIQYECVYSDNGSIPSSKLRQYILLRNVQGIKIFKDVVSIFEERIVLVEVGYQEGLGASGHRQGTRV